MKYFNEIVISFLLVLLVCSCSKKIKYAIDVDEVTPWCILEFDSLDRSPQERITMLKEMKIKTYGYNWRERHLNEMKEEFSLAKSNGIEITSVFLWLNAKRDSIGKLSSLNQEMLNNLKEVEYKPSIWLSFSNNFFEEIDQEQSMAFSIEMIKFIKNETDKIGCKLALYNHHGWFGNPHNQVEIIKALPQESLTMVFNFHHAHEYLDEFEDVAKKIKTHLSMVNLNGMKKEGSKILTIGNGDFEYEMVKTLFAEGYNGPWGILGHVKTEDVKEVLMRNIEGLNQLNVRYKDETGKKNKN